MGSTYIGRSVRVIEDPARVEVFESGICRSFPVSIFYPTQAESCRNSTVLDLFYPARDEAIKAFLNQGITRDSLAFQIRVHDNATPDLRHPRPVLIFSPGFGIDRDLYIELHTSLVEAGYVVVTVGVPYDSFLTVFPSGRVVLQADRFPADGEQVRTRVQDIKLVLAHLAIWNEEPALRGIFDLHRIGVMGHSLGGASVFEFAARESRLRCAVLLDASLHLLGCDIPDIPVLNVRQDAASLAELRTTIQEDDGEKLATAYIQTQQRLYESLPQTSSFVKIASASHLSFSTIPALLGESDLATSSAIQQVVCAYLREFLKGEEGAYSELLGSGNRPVQLVEIDGLGFPVGT